MDFSNLIKVRNGESLTPIADAHDLRVRRKSGTVLDDAINSRTHRYVGDRERISDRRYKPTQISNISRSTSKTRYVVLDSRAIDEIADMSNAQRRGFLSKLSDGERRKVLRELRARRVADGLDDGMVRRRDLNRTLEPQDLYVINDLLTKFAYSRKDDELRMLESYKDILDENDGQELAVLTLINKVIDGDLDLEADSDVINDVFNFLEDNDFETESLEASLNAGFGDTVAESSDIVGEDEDALGDELGGDDDLDLDGDGDLEDGGNEESNMDIEDEEEEGGDVDLGLADSAKKKPLKIDIASKIRDSKADAKKERLEPFSKVEPLIIDDSYDLAMAMLKGETLNIHDGVSNIIEKYTNRCGDSVRVKDTFDRAFAKSVQQISDYLHKEQQRVKDDIIEQIDEKLGEDSEESESATILQSLGSALEAYANGDATELEALSELTLEDINPQDEDAEEEETEDENAEEKEAEDEGFDLELTDSAVNAINLAKALINKDKSANAIIDKLKDQVGVLKKYNFKISDSEIYEEELDDVDVVEPLLTHDEFRSVYQYPAYVGEMAKEANPSQCVSIESVNYGDLSPVIQVECNGVTQNWMPIMGSSEDVVAKLEAEDADAAAVISDCCVPVEDYYAAAAKTNNLGIVDSKFYKRKLSDEGWVCDELPSFITDEACEAGATFVPSGLTTMGKMIPSGSVLIYGTKYDYYNKLNKKKQ